MQDYDETMLEYETTIPAADEPSSMAVISPAQHAVLDYLVAGAFINAGLAFLPRHKPAATLAFLNGAPLIARHLGEDFARL